MYIAVTFTRYNFCTEKLKKIRRYIRMHNYVHMYMQTYPVNAHCYMQTLTG